MPYFVLRSVVFAFTDIGANACVWVRVSPCVRFSMCQKAHASCRRGLWQCDRRFFFTLPLKLIRSLSAMSSTFPMLRYSRSSTFSSGILLCICGPLCRVFIWSSNTMLCSIFVYFVCASSSFLGVVHFIIFFPYIFFRFLSNAPHFTLFPFDIFKVAHTQCWHIMLLLLPPSPPSPPSLLLMPLLLLYCNTFPHGVS